MAILPDIYWAGSLLPEHNDPVYPVNSCFM